MLEGRSLRPLLRRQTGSDQRPDALRDAAAGRDWRECAVSEGDYAFRSFVREPLGRPVDGCRTSMIRSRRFKYVHYDGLAPQLFDLDQDPDEYVDLGTDPGYVAVRDEHFAMLWDWIRHRKIHPTVACEAITDSTDRELRLGIQVGQW